MVDVERVHERERSIAMVRPRIDRLSVFITPWQKPTACQRAIN